MSISELNHFMTYVIEGWMLFSAGFISTTFVSFVSRRIQEDMEAAALAEGVMDEVTVTEAVEAAIEQSVAASVSASPSGQAGDEPLAEESAPETDEEEAARLEEVAAVSEQLAKNRDKQSDSSSVSVST